MGALKYALVGGLQGLGEGMIEEAENRRQEALLRLRETSRQGAYDQRRRDDLTDLSAENKREDAQRAQDRLWEVEDLDKREAGLGRRSRSRGTRRGKGYDPSNLSAGVIKRIDTMFEDVTGRNVDRVAANKFRDEVVRLMREDEGLSEQDAKRIAEGGMVYEDEVKENSSIWDFKRETTRTDRNREGRGKWTGEFSYGSGGSGLGGTKGRRALDTSHIPQAAVDALRTDPSRREEFDAKFGDGMAAAVLGS